MTWDVIVIGAGAAGLLAAARAAQRGRRVLLVEKNRKAGVKILMSGGTRCNLTHAVDKWGIIEAFADQGPFLHSALAALGPADLVQLIEAEGVKTKVEATGKIFPASDKATDVLAALLRLLHRSGAELSLNEPVINVELMEGKLQITTASRSLQADKVIITTGGKSYPGCGTSGDGYAWTEKLGHTIIPRRPALVPVTTTAEWVKSLLGVTIEDVSVRVETTQQNDSHPTDNSSQATSPGNPSKKKRQIRDTPLLAERRGSFLFTHFGLSGPSILDVSRAITAQNNPSSLQLVCDFLPGTSSEDYASRLQNECAAAGKKQIAGILALDLPRRLADSLVQLANIPADRRAAELSKHERATLVQVVKACRIPIAGTKGFKKAEVTAGGVTLDEIDSRTMQSKLVPNLYLAGEVLDLDGPIGGYNFQAAWSTGFLAGQSV